jgi:hypothetical protein
MIGGNTTIQIQIITGTNRDSVGNRVPTFETVQSMTGFLDFAAGDSKRTTFNAKIQESTHVFIADYVPLAEGITAENSKVIDEDGLVYDVMVFDDPMKLHKQWEIYLKYTGGQ